MNEFQHAIDPSGGASGEKGGKKKHQTDTASRQGPEVWKWPKQSHRRIIRWEQLHRDTSLRRVRKLLNVGRISRAGIFLLQHRRHGPEARVTGNVLLCLFGALGIFALLALESPTRLNQPHHPQGILPAEHVSRTRARLFCRFCRCPKCRRSHRPHHVPVLRCRHRAHAGRPRGDARA